MSSVYIARQPIVTLEEKLEAYEVLYVDSMRHHDISDNRYASAAVMNTILNRFGTQEFLSDCKAFLKVDERFLMSDLIKTVPKDFFTLSIFSDIDFDDKIVERIEQLRKLGYSLAINDTDLTEEHINKLEKVLDLFNFFKINMNHPIGKDSKELIERLKSHDLKIVATKIESDKQYQLAKTLGCGLFQGYCFAKPEILENEKFDPARFNVLKIYNMLMQDTNLDEITAEFEKNYALSVQLLQFINSAHFSFQNKISSIHHVLSLVGRKPLSQWLMLMIYSKAVSESDNVSPLLLMVKNRTELMQKLLKALKPDVGSNALGEAYLVGVLSLIGKVFHARTEDVLENIHVSDLTKNAILYDEGTLGTLYKTVRDIEEFNISEIMNFCEKYKLEESSVQEIILECIDEVNALEKSLKVS